MPFKSFRSLFESNPTPATLDAEQVERSKAFFDAYGRSSSLVFVVEGATVCAGKEMAVALFPSGAVQVLEAEKGDDFDRLSLALTGGSSPVDEAARPGLRLPPLSGWSKVSFGYMIQGPFGTFNIFEPSDGEGSDGSEGGWTAQHLNTAGKDGTESGTMKYFSRWYRPAKSGETPVLWLHSKPTPAETLPTKFKSDKDAHAALAKYAGSLVGMVEKTDESSAGTTVSAGSFKNIYNHLLSSRASGGGLKENEDNMAYKNLQEAENAIISAAATGAIRADEALRFEELSVSKPSAALVYAEQIVPKVDEASSYRPMDTARYARMMRSRRTQTSAEKARNRDRRRSYRANRASLKIKRQRRARKVGTRIKMAVAKGRYESVGADVDYTTVSADSGVLSAMKELAEQATVYPVFLENGELSIPSDVFEGVLSVFLDADDSSDLTLEEAAAQAGWSFPEDIGVEFAGQNPVDEGVSLNALAQAFPKVDKSKWKDIKSRMQDAEFNRKGIDAILSDVSDLIGGHGVEVIPASEIGGSSAKVACRYVNMGDSYAKTVMFADGKFSVGSWGDWLEYKQSKMGADESRKGGGSSVDEVVMTTSAKKAVESCGYDPKDVKGVYARLYAVVQEAMDRNKTAGQAEAILAAAIKKAFPKADDKMVEAVSTYVMEGFYAMSGVDEGSGKGANAAFNKNVKDIERYLRNISGGLAEFKRMFAGDPENFGYVGDLGSVIEHLKAAAAVFDHTDEGVVRTDEAGSPSLSPEDAARRKVLLGWKKKAVEAYRDAARDIWTFTDSHDQWIDAQGMNDPKSFQHVEEAIFNVARYALILSGFEHHMSGEPSNPGSSPYWKPRDQEILQVYGGKTVPESADGDNTNMVNERRGDATKRNPKRAFSKLSVRFRKAMANRGTKHGDARYAKLRVTMGKVVAKHGKSLGLFKESVYGDDGVCMFEAQANGAWADSISKKYGVDAADVLAAVKEARSKKQADKKDYDVRITQESAGKDKAVVVTAVGKTPNNNYALVFSTKGVDESTIGSSSKVCPKCGNSDASKFSGTAENPVCDACGYDGLAETFEVGDQVPSPRNESEDDTYTCPSCGSVGSMDDLDIEDGVAVCPDCGYEGDESEFEDDDDDSEDDEEMDESATVNNGVMLKPFDDWSVSAGGTGVKDGLNSYSTHIKDAGEYHIDPDAKGKKWTLQYATRGSASKIEHPKQNGLWRTVGVYTTPKLAYKGAVADFKEMTKNDLFKGNTDESRVVLKLDKSMSDSDRRTYMAVREATVNGSTTSILEGRVDHYTGSNEFKVRRYVNGAFSDTVDVVESESAAVEVFGGKKPSTPGGGDSSRQSPASVSLSFDMSRAAEFADVAEAVNNDDLTKADLKVVGDKYVVTITPALAQQLKGLFSGAGVSYT